MLLVTLPIHSQNRKVLWPDGDPEHPQNVSVIHSTMSNQLWKFHNNPASPNEYINEGIDKHKNKERFYA